MLEDYISGKSFKTRSNFFSNDYLTNLRKKKFLTPGFLHIERSGARDMAVERGTCQDMLRSEFSIFSRKKIFF
jgi:hypothetical protein